MTSIPTRWWRQRALRLSMAACLALATAPTTWAQAAKPPSPEPASKAPQRPATATRPAAEDTAGFTIAPRPAWADDTPVEPPPADLPKAAVQVLLVERQTRLSEPGAAPPHQHRRTVMQVNESAGLEAASRIEIEFAPDHQKLVLHELTVQRGTQRSNRLNPQQVKLLHREPQLERQLLDGRMTAVIILDDLRVGDRVNLSYSVVGANPVFGGRFVEQDWTQSSKGPVALYRYRLLTPASRPIQHQVGSAAIDVRTTQTGALRETVFTRRGVPAFHFDPSAPWDIHLDDQIQLSEFKDWADVATWAAGLFNASAAPGTGVRELATRIRAAHDTPAARLRAALDTVQNDVRYFGVEIDENSHRPRPAEVVLQQRFGDCKDKVSLMMALAHELGLPADGVLVSTRQPERVARMLASPLAFDHAILSVVLDGQTLWLDPTRVMQTGEARTRQPTGLGFGLPAQRDAQAPRELPGATNVLRSEVEDLFRFGSLSGDATLETRQTFHGELAEWVRLARARMPAEEFANALRQEVNRAYTGLSPKGEPQIDELPGLNALRVVQTFTLANPWRFPEQKQLTMEFSLYTLMSPLRLADQSPRSRPLRVEMPGIYRHVLRAQYAEPMTGRTSTQRAEERGLAFALDVQYETLADGQRIQGELRLPVTRIAPDEWSRHRDQLVKAWPRLGGSLLASALSPSQQDGLRARLSALDDDLRRGRIVATTSVQRDAHARVLILNEQLASGRLAPRLRAEALLARGRLLDHLARGAAANADFTEALSLKPNDGEILGALAVNALLRGADDDAVRHADAALVASPTDLGPRYTRAFAQFHRADWAAARAELEQILQQRGEAERSYAPIWLYLTVRRAGGDGAAALKDLPLARPDGRPSWPAPVLDYLRGTARLADAEAAAGVSGAPDPGRLCELYFYAGQKALLDGDPAQARRWFQQSVDTGVVEFNEHAMARRALARLKGGG